MKSRLSLRAIPALKPLRIGFALWLALSLSGAHAGILEDDEARKAILDLRAKLEATTKTFDTMLAERQQKYTDDLSNLRQGLVDLQNQIETLRTDNAQLRGQIEQQQRELKDAQRRVADQGQALDDRIKKLEPISVSLDGKDFLVEQRERAAYDNAWATFKKGEFDQAQRLFVDFIQHYPQSGYRSTALFWLGNAQYATRDYKEAIINFRALLAAEPQHVRAPETMLSIANCQLELKDLKAARKTLDELVVAFPKSEAAQAASERLARIK